MKVLTAKDVKEVEALCARALESAGFVVRAGVGSILIDGDFYGWIGLNSGLHSQFIRINPAVGVHCSKIMKMTAAAAGRKYKPFEVATYATPLLTLCSAIPEFVFRSETDAGEEAARLANSVVEFGLPFVKKISGYDGLIPLLGGRVGMLGGYPQRYAAALFLAGRRDDAFEFLDAKIAQFGNEGELDLVTALSALRDQMQ